MPFAIPYPNIDPVLFTIPLFGLELPIRWYALAYLGGLLLGLVIMRRIMARAALWPGNQAPLNADQVEALLTWIVVGDLGQIEAPLRALALGEVSVLDAEGEVLR